MRLCSRPFRLLMITLASAAAAVMTGAMTCTGGGSNPPPLIPAGDYDRSIVHDDLPRTYKLHVPPQYDGSQALPLVFMFHGGFGDAENASLHYGWREKADAEGFFAVFPQGVGTIPTWHATHCCGAALLTNADDLGFVEALVAELQRILLVDAGRIYATGMSNGGMLTHRLGAELPNIFAAIAPVAGTIGGQFNSDGAVFRPRQPRGPMPIIMFHGTADEHVKYYGGPTILITAGGRVDLSVAESAGFWVDANNAGPTISTDTSAGGNVIKETWAHQGNFADVVLYSIVGQGHAWPGGILPRPGADQPSMDISATDAIWDFFVAHPKR